MPKSNHAATELESQRHRRETDASDLGGTISEASATVFTVPVLAHLRELRIRAALSQRDLARLAGVAHTTIVRLEGGDPNVLPSTLRKIAKALHVKPADLIG
jgi:DNA-binding XRE family transcriptional regulator